MESATNQSIVPAVAAAALGKWPATSEERAHVEAIRRELAEYGEAKLAKQLGIYRTAVNNWLGIVPGPRVRAVSQITGIAMKRLRPDLHDPHFRQEAVSEATTA